MGNRHASRVGLSHEAITDAAVGLLEAEGADSLTMRLLAERLGVGTMTLYGYFRGKDELLEAIADRAARQVVDADVDSDWKTRLRTLVLEVHRSHLAHPAVVELRLRRPLLSRGALEVTERAMAILISAGFSPPEAARVYRLLFIFAFGFSAFGPPGRESESDVAREALAGLPVDRYPILRAAVDEAAQAMSDPTLFDFGLATLLDGLERLLER